MQQDCIIAHMKYLKYVLLGLLVGLNFSAFARENSSCRRDMIREHQSGNRNLLASYKLLNFKGKKKVRSKFNRSKLLLGDGTKDEAVIVLHGFLASPFEVEPVTTKLNDLGFTVYAPTLFGFGSYANIANQTNRTHWMSTLHKSIRLISNCYDKVHLVGFSLGATIVSRFLVKSVYQSDQYTSFNPNRSLYIFDSQNSNVNNDFDDRELEITSATLLAPYYSLGLFGASAMNSFASKFINKIPLKTLNIIKNADLKIPLNYPRKYNESMPLHAALEVVDFGEETLEIQPRDDILVPILTAYSEADQTIDISAVHDFLDQDYFPNMDYFIYEEDRKIPHQLLFFGEEKVDNRSLFESIQDHILSSPHESISL
jgi:esterase/lipase